MDRNIKTIIVAIIVLLVLMPLFFMFKSVPAGHVAVATLFGKAKTQPYPSGLHFPVNPFYKWTEYDTRQKSHKEVASVPSQDQLTTKIEVSVQYRILSDKASVILRETGTAEDIKEVHLVPKLRSLLREQGKSVVRAEDFFLEETQERIQSALTAELSEFMKSKGAEVQAVLLRDISLPAFITRAIEQKKEREQEVQKQKAELERYETEQQQIVASAKAKRQAAEEEAATRKMLADARAYEIQKINESVADNPAYIKLQALEALQAISKDPAAKIYFINSDSPMPLPLMHLGEK